MKGNPNTRNRLLDAAAGIVAQSGAGNLTIDAVAESAGLSKGGVLYHFPSKRDLLQGMLERLLEEFQSRTAALTAEGQPSLLHAHIESVLHRPAGEQAASLAVLANAAEDPSLLEPARELLIERTEQILAEAKDPVQALIVFLASEGIRFLEVMNLLPLEADLLERVGSRLATMAEESSR